MQISQARISRNSLYAFAVISIRPPGKRIRRLFDRFECERRDRESYESHFRADANLVRPIIPTEIRIATSGITTAGVPIVRMASERK